VYPCFYIYYNGTEGLHARVRHVYTSLIFMTVNMCVVHQKVRNCKVTVTRRVLE